jgi:hypothetical protein
MPGIGMCAESVGLDGISSPGMPGIFIESVFDGAVGIFIPGISRWAESPCMAWVVSGIRIFPAFAGTRCGFAVLFPAAGFFVVAGLAVAFFF